MQLTIFIYSIYYLAQTLGFLRKLMINQSFCFFKNINYYYYTANICKLQIAQCEYKLHHRFLGLSHTGTCSSSGGTVSVPDHYDCRNPEPCDEEETTGEVCGSDGVTYSRRENLNSGRIRFAVEDDT